MLKSIAMKRLKVDIRQLKNWLKNDFKEYDNHRSIARLVGEIQCSLKTTKTCVNDILEQYIL
ncbi:unnamed protein product [marine sediment metagenome]|uniref:Uncharacterized protein n=1 Tax=marine sediment metagenome TaxID=412755 RepID=X1GK81_9ZZZZ